jgi:hypothetical protein
VALHPIGEKRVEFSDNESADRTQWFWALAPLSEDSAEELGELRQPNELV